MNQIDRKGWKKVTFGDVCKNLNLAITDPENAGIERYVGLEHIVPENLRIRSWGQVADGTTFTKTFKAGQVLFGKRRAYQKKTALAHFDGICSGDILVFESNEKLIDSKLLPFLVSSDRFFEYAVQTSAGSLSPRTKFQDLAKFEFLLPSKDQQAKLATLLWSGDEVVERYEEALDSLAKLRKSYHKAKFNLKETRSIAEIATKVGSGKTPLGGEKVYTTAGVIFLRSQNILTDNLSLDDVVYIDEATNDSMRSTTVKFNDVLLNITGASIGRSALYNLNEEANVNQHVCIIRSETYCPLVLCEYLNSEFGQEQIKTLQTAGNRQGLNFQNLRQLKVPKFGGSEIVKIEKEILGIKNQIARLKDVINRAKQTQKQIINQIFSA